MIENNEFIENLKEVLFESQEIVITEDSQFRQFDEWDSLIGMSIQVMLKDKYDVDLKTEIFEKLQTVGDIIGFVNKNIENHG